jgi:hypothetical protein
MCFIFFLKHYHVSENLGVFLKPHLLIEINGEKNEVDEILD